MQTFKLHHKGLIFEDIPFDSLTMQLQRQGVIVSLPHELKTSGSIGEVDLKGLAERMRPKGVDRGVRWKEGFIAGSNYFQSNVEEYDLNKLYDWLMDENRKPAQTAFTASVARNIAREIEYRFASKVEEDRLLEAKRLVGELHALMPYHINPYNLGETGQVSAIITKLHKLINSP